MGAMICKQPNGKYCRFSTVVDTVTDYNFTKEEYISGITGTVKNNEEAKEIIENHTRPFLEVIERFQAENESVEEFNKKLIEMGSEVQLKS